MNVVSIPSFDSHAWIARDKQIFIQMGSSGVQSSITGNAHPPSEIQQTFRTSILHDVALPIHFYGTGLFSRVVFSLDRSNGLSRRPASVFERLFSAGCVKLSDGVGLIKVGCIICLMCCLIGETEQSLFCDF